MNRLLSLLSVQVDASGVRLFAAAIGLLLIVRTLIELHLAPVWGEFPPGFGVDQFQWIDDQIATERIPYIRLDIFQWGSSSAWFFGTRAVYIGLSALVMLGASHWSIYLLLHLFTMSYAHSWSILISGGDTLLQCFTFWLMILPKPKREGGQWTVARLTPFILVGQLALVYWSSGIIKLFDPLWRRGEVLNVALRLPNHTRGWTVELPDAPEALLMLAYLALAFELTFPFGVASRRLRSYYMAVGLLLHLCIELTLKIGNFSWVMLASYALLTPPRLNPLVRIRAWVSRRALSA